MLRLLRLSLLVVVVLPVMAWAGEIELAEPKDNSDPEYLEKVLAPNARCAAVADHLKLLAIGHRAGPGPNLSLFRLGDKGIPGEKAVEVAFPVPPVLKDRPGFAVGLAFHPKYPLLYVWRNMHQLKEGKDPAEQEFDHLLIYNVEGPQPELLLSQCRGPQYALVAGDGAIALDRAAKRLYLPNMLTKAQEKQPAVSVVGYLHLDTTGLPAIDDKGNDVAPADAAAAKALRTTRLAAVRAFQPKGTPGRIFACDAALPWNGYPAGFGFVPVSDDVVIVGSTYGPVVWDESNRRARFNSFFIHSYYGAPYVDRLAAHPTLPVVYLSVLNVGWIFRMEHAEGYLTLAPQKVILTGAVLHSYPVALAKRNQVAVGGVNHVHLVALDAKGAFKAERMDVGVQNPTTMALTYSEKFDRLYVAVEKLP